nr:HAD hydrolase family protein [Lactococcus lactis]
MENINDYKALAFFDLDGTLLNSQSKLDQEVIEGIHRIRENGVLPFLVPAGENFGT